MTRNYRSPVWGTQGGGLVRQVGDTYIFVEKPDCPGLEVGDTMPSEWSVVPANAPAQAEVREADFSHDDMR